MVREARVAPRLNPRALAVRSMLRLAYGGFPPEDGAFRRSVSWGDEGSSVVRRVLEEGRPCLVTRFGSIELACASFYTRWRPRKGLRLPYLLQARRAVRANAGVFPIDDASLDRFSERYLDAISHSDVMGVCFNRNEHRTVERYCPAARLVQIEALNAVVRDDPWTAALEGKKVLVVHPFARTIESQYRTRRTKLFDDPRILPEFEIRTLAAVQSLAGNDGGFRTWFDALDSMTERMAAIDFEVAIIGAGAYGLPLGAAVKEMGRQAVHMGGATQLLFGIRGRRWDVEYDDMSHLFNEWWVRPSLEETPAGSRLVEGGCYW